MIKYCSECGLRYGKWALKKTAVHGRRTPHSLCEECTLKLAIEDEIKRLHQVYEDKMKALSLVKDVQKNLKAIKYKAITSFLSNKRRSLLKKAVGSHTVKYIAYLLKEQKYKCIACLVDITDTYQVDHIYPLSRGGGNGEDNIQLLCQPCNGRKGAKDPISFLQMSGLRTYCDI